MPGTQTSSCLVYKSLGIVQKNPQYKSKVKLNDTIVTCSKMLIATSPNRLFLFWQFPYSLHRVNGLNTLHSWWIRESAIGEFSCPITAMFVSYTSGLSMSCLQMFMCHLSLWGWAQEPSKHGPEVQHSPPELVHSPSLPCQPPSMCLRTGARGATKPH